LTLYDILVIASVGGVLLLLVFIRSATHVPGTWLNDRIFVIAAADGCDETLGKLHPGMKSGVIQIHRKLGRHLPGEAIGRGPKRKNHHEPMCPDELISRR
jgi:hypothetical protein